MKKRKLNKVKTIEKILKKCSSSIGYSINVDKFNKRRDNVDFITRAAKLVSVEPVYFN